jgi:hypothetical protein
MAAELNGSTHPYWQLLASEFRFVGENPLTHTAHEYLSEFNYCYTCREFLELLSKYRFAYVADADFNYRSGRLPEDLASQIARLGIDGETTDAATDLLLYRQLHSPVLTQNGFARRVPDIQELSAITVASSLTLVESQEGNVALFAHQSGYQVEARSGSIAAALNRLQAVWPSVDTQIQPLIDTANPAINRQPRR